MSFCSFTYFSPPTCSGQGIPKYREYQKRGVTLSIENQGQNKITKTRCKTYQIELVKIELNVTIGKMKRDLNS